MGAAAKKVEAQEVQPKKRPTVSSVELPPPDDVVPSPYPPDVQVYAYQPKGGGDPILLPLNGFEPPDKLWHFDVAQLPMLAQTWRWMELAKVPKSVQRQAQTLPDSEYFGAFTNEWFEAIRIYRQSGGPKGSVTAGK